MTSCVNTSTLPSPRLSDWTSCWWTSVLELGGGSSRYVTWILLWEPLNSSTIWDRFDLPKNLALAKVRLVVPELEAPEPPHAARADPRAADPSTAPPARRNERRDSAEGVRGGVSSIDPPRVASSEEKTGRERESMLFFA